MEENRPMAQHEQEQLEAKAQKLLEERLLSEIAAAMTEGGEILDYETTARTVDGMLQVTVEAACRDQIGRAMPSAGTPSTQEGAE